MHFYLQSPLIDDFLKPITQLTMHSYCTTDNFAGYVFVLHMRIYK